MKHATEQDSFAMRENIMKLKNKELRDEDQNFT
jgi:hypothetical protein